MLRAALRELQEQHVATCSDLQHQLQVRSGGRGEGEKGRRGARWGEDHVHVRGCWMRGVWSVSQEQGALPLIVPSVSTGVECVVCSEGREGVEHSTRSRWSHPPSYHTPVPSHC